MLVMLEKGIRGQICHAIHKYVKENNKCMKNYKKDNESSYIWYLDANNLYGWAMSQKLPVNGFKWKKTKQMKIKIKEKKFKCNEDFKNTIMETAIKNLLLKQLLNIINIYMIYSVI